MTSSAKRVVVLDRDGTVNVEKQYLSDPAQVELVPGAAEGLRHLASLGLDLIVITNQSGVGRGYFSQQTLDQIHERLGECLEAEGVELGAIYVCPHVPSDACACRKPRTALLERAARERGFDPREAFVIGDKSLDMEFGRRAGSTTLLVRTGYGAEAAAEIGLPADYIVDDLREASRVIEGLLTSPKYAPGSATRQLRHET
jgi:D-glycero-D-manno-heptose 1,7-bisphosphate phosphatase